MTTKEISDKARTFFPKTFIMASDKWRRIKARGILQDGKTIALRLILKDDIPYVYVRNSHKYIQPLSCRYDLQDIMPVQSRDVSKQQKWIKGWQKVQKRLEQSGLWTSLLSQLKLAQEIGYDKLQAASEAYWGNHGDQVNAVRAVDERLIRFNDKQEPYVDTELVWFFSKQPRVKKMYFGRYNTRIPEAIKNAMTNKTKYETGARTNYDVSFTYNPEYNKATYSEEYKGCGNGHYYLALDATHAIFCEDD